MAGPPDAPPPDLRAASRKPALPAAPEPKRYPPGSLRQAFADMGLLPPPDDDGQ
jgi:hypothetical protein